MPKKTAASSASLRASEDPRYLDMLECCVEHTAIFSPSAWLSIDQAISESSHAASIFDWESQAAGKCKYDLGRYLVRDVQWQFLRVDDFDAQISIDRTILAAIN